MTPQERMQQLEQQAMARQRMQQLEQQAMARQSQTPVSEASNQPGFWQSLRHGADNIAQGFTHGVRQTLPPVDMALSAAGLEHPGPTEGSFVGSAAQYAGELAPAAVAGTAALASRGAALATNPNVAAPGRVQGAVDHMGRSLQQHLARSPGQAAAIEGGALTGAAVGYAGAEDSPIPGAQEVAGLAGGLVGGGVTGAPRWAADRAGAYYNRMQKNLNPWSQRGAEMRVNEQRQARAADPLLAEQAVRDGPRDIPPALLTEQPHLIAEQRRAAQQNPEVEARLREMVTGARQTRQSELRGMTEGARESEDWAHRVMQRVAPPGTGIDPNDPDLMMRQVLDSYGPAYRDFQGRAQTRGLGAELRDAIMDQSISGDPRNQRHVLDEVRRLTQDVNRRVDPQTGEVNVQDLFTLRETIRAKRMQYLSHDPEDRQFRSLYENAENIITRRIEDTLPPDQHQRLMDLDRRYRGFSTVREAMSRGEGLSQGSLESALAMRTGSTEYAVGGGDLRALTRLGVSTDRLWGNPTLASTVVRDAPPADAKALRGAFLEEMLSKATRMDPRSGEMAISGMQLRELVRQEERVLRNLQMSDKDLTKLRRLSSELTMLERNPEVEVGALMEDPTSRVMDLVGALVGAKLGQRVAGEGLGSSLVLAGRGSKDVRSRLAKAISDRARQRYEAGLTNHDAYMQSLRGPTSAVRPGLPERPGSRGITAPITGDMGQTIYDEVTQ